MTTRRRFLGGCTGAIATLGVAAWLPTAARSATPQPSNGQGTGLFGSPSPATSSATRVTIARDGRTFATLQAAVNQGGTIELSAGELDGLAACAFTSRPIRIVGAGTTLHARGIADKGIIIVNGDTTLEDIAIAGARSTVRNGAGVRHQAGTLLLRKVKLQDNENGLLGPPASAHAPLLDLDECEVDGNGDGSGYSHGLYVGNVMRFVCRRSRFHATAVGHHIKSRAHASTIEHCEIGTDFDGTESYNIDAPQAGEVAVVDCVLRQGPRTANPAMLHYGGEINVHSPRALRIVRCRFESKAGGTAIRNVLPDVVAEIVDCEFIGVDRAVFGRYTMRGCRLNAEALPDRS
ncbi:MAG TPA: twin-arginine translocation signal domain-containing protein [Casimicrobiaceae bacterium]|nr:twin-arginine translocation signal domain-containing protein [Casimicrobiaceae bacterium]